VWILVIHYDFADATDGSQRRGNTRDVHLLRDVFSEYKDCTFREIASPKTNEIAKILSKDGILSRFEKGQKGK
jgi:hypothetical protein